MKLNIEPVSTDHRFWNKINLLAKEAFPPEEYLAPEKLVQMAQAEHFDFWALTDNDLFIGFMVVQTYHNLAYLFFLAIDSNCRSKGYGSHAIETLKASYPGKKQVVDFEMLDKTAANYSQRKKRKDFYLRNGYRETGLFLSYYGVDYEVMCMDNQFEPAEYKELMKQVQIEGFHPTYFCK